jgi:hypothetical protein
MGHGHIPSMISLLTLALVLTVPANAQDAAEAEEYVVGVLEPGGPPPRLPDGHVDLTGHWFPNGAGQGVSGRFGVDRRSRPKRRPSFRTGRGSASSR